MSENTTTHSSIEKPGATPGSATPGIDIVDALPELYGLREGSDKSTLRWSLAIAAVFHLVLLAIHFPALTGPREITAQEKKPVFVVKTVRFQPPTPRQQQQVPKPKARKIPIPDPTPTEPEPIVEDELEIPDLDFPNLGDVAFGIPDAPPGLPGDPLQVGGDVMAPRKLHAPPPAYTEEARKARVQGAVILQAVIDSMGDVSDVKVLKGLSLGLTDSAVNTVKQWKYEPATQDGMPVPVYLNLVVTFSLQ